MTKPSTQVEKKAYWCPRCERPTALRMWNYHLNDWADPFCPQCAWSATPVEALEARIRDLTAELEELVAKLVAEKAKP